ncbi:MAG: M23 family metallopeptidase [Deltaproteobacteria bacterium]
MEYAVEEPLKSALGQLNERSRKIESILDFVGIDVKPDPADKPEGGPYAQLPGNEMDMDNLLYRVDSYLDVILPIPLGYPVNGYISSGFGRRIDPFTGKLAFHPGVDIVANFGSKVRATADGIVRLAGYDKGYGRCVMIDHGNGFKTVYGHNSKLLVKRGDHVVRGQVISLVGRQKRRMAILQKAVNSTLDPR